MNLAVILIEIVIMLIGFGSLVFGMLMISPLTWVYMLCVFAWDTFFLDWVLFAGCTICDFGWLSQQRFDALDLVQSIQ